MTLKLTVRSNEYWAYTVKYYPSSIIDMAIDQFQMCLQIYYMDWMFVLINTFSSTLYMKYLSYWLANSKVGLNKLCIVFALNDKSFVVILVAFKQLERLLCSYGYIKIFLNFWFAEYTYNFLWLKKYSISVL